MKSHQTIVWSCLLIAATSASSVARHPDAPSAVQEVHPLLRIRRQSTGTGGLCVPEGGYCTKQFHCCSGICQTFSYKCVPRHSQGAQIDLVSMIIESTSGAFGGLENRFGENNTAPVCAKDGEYCQMSAQCCSRRCLSYSYKCVPDHSLVPPDGSSNSPVASIPQNVITIEELISNRFGEPSATANASGGSCLSNGVACSDSNKCCSKFCAQATLNSRVCIPRSNEVRPQGPQTQPPSTALVPQSPQNPPVDYASSEESSNPTGCEPIGRKVHPLLRIRRQSTGTGGLCVPEGGYCTKQFHCCSGICQTFSYKCVPRHSQGAQIDLVSMIIESTSGAFGGLENRFGENNTAPVCAKDGEYCQMSAQCCSRRCLSYSYKCVPDHSLVPPDGSSNSPVASIPQNVITIEELISNRFGEPSATANANGGSCLSNGVACSDSNKCCSKFCAQATLNSRVCVPRSNEVRPQGPQTQPPSTALVPQSPQNPPVDYASSEESSNPTGCEPIGRKCYIHEECCSRRCHGFLHQCVT
uniref:Putative conserved secreted protein n=1 Tax=Lutzomyia longipalpis TaxID=7200 RepID=A0A7G3AG13_LUTLO